MPSYFYILTLQWLTQSGSRSETWSGMAELRANTTRGEAFVGIMNDIRSKASIGDNCCCLFFSLEPNKLSA